MIKIAICDDNEKDLFQLKDLIFHSLKQYSSDIKIDIYARGSDLLESYKNNEYEILFLDIDMPDMSGFDIAKKIRKDFLQSYIIFVTSHSELVYESLDFQPFHFIRKNCSIPLDESVANVTKKLIRQLRQHERIILEDDISGRCGVYIKDIIYIESDKHYLTYHILNRELPITVRGTMKDCESRFSSYDFVRIHKKYIINLRCLARFNSKDDEVLLKPVNKKLPMSKKLKNVVDEKYTKYLRSTI